MIDGTKRMTETTGAILDHHFSVNYRAKVIDWFDTGGPDYHRRYTLHELYCAIQDLFDHPDQSNDMVPMKALSRHEFKMDNGWTITAKAVAHLKLIKRPKYDWLLYENGVHVEGRHV